MALSDPQSAAADRLAEARRLRAASQPDAALRAQTAAVVLLREAGDDARLAHALRHQAEMLIEAGQPHEAKPVIDEVRTLHATRPPADPLEAANTLRVAALQAEACGDLAATDLWTQARDAYAALEERFSPGPNAGVNECRAHLAALDAAR